jgi:hypothetical protein
MFPPEMAYTDGCGFRLPLLAENQDKNGLLSASGTVNVRKRAMPVGLMAQNICENQR